MLVHLFIGFASHLKKKIHTSRLELVILGTTLRIHYANYVYCVYIRYIYWLHTNFWQANFLV